MEWFRVYHGTCQNPKLHKASRIAGVSRALVIAVWIAVLEKASKAEERGDLSGLDPDEVAFVTGVKPKTASAIISAMIDVELIVDGRPKGWDDRQPAGDDREISSHQWEILKRQIRARDMVCVYCGDADGPFDVDHVFPRSRGGADHPENLVLSCMSCNRSKGARTPEEWLGRGGELMAERKGRSLG